MLRIAAIADLHYAGGPLEACGVRRTAITDILLTRAVRRLNKFIKPDLTIFLGDMMDNGRGERASEEQEHLLAILAKLESPYIIIPGNHDGNLVWPDTMPESDSPSSQEGVRGRSAPARYHDSIPFALLCLRDWLFLVF